MKRLVTFWGTDPGKIILYCLIAGLLMSVVDWMYDDWRELAWGVVIISCFVINELRQYHWQFLKMGKQSWREWIYPAVVVLIIYAV